MEIAPTSYLRVNGASIVDDSGTAVRLQGPCLGGWMNMENFITGYPASETLQRRALLKAMGPETYEAFFDQFLTDFFTESDAAYLAGLGANAMRIPINYRHFESDEQPKVLIEAGLRWLDRAVDTMAAHGIYSIIDMHAVPGFQNHHWHSDNPTHWPLFWEYADFKRASHLALGGPGRSLQGQRVGRRLQPAQRARRRGGRQTHRVVLRGSTPGA